ncbi:phage major tail tube protein [Yersinia bercovieri]|uniref:phage major tail tube protein n=1 Tax=Yersinia bercovieri TaxID=634 RepID=UPI00119CA900|nr:phage major tail tube protein [Yersinia bercovieri]
MALPRKLKFLNVFNDGNSYQGVVESITLPKLSRKFEEFRGGGMNGSAKVDLGLADGALDVDWTLGGIESEIYKQWGVTKVDGVLLRFAGSYQRDDTGETHAVEIVMRGRHEEIDGGDSKQGDNTTTKISTKNTYYKLTWDGEVLIEIDIVNMVEMVNGVDMLEAHRRNIGL